jgi:arylsulfatase A-like enzyme
MRKHFLALLVLLLTAGARTLAAERPPNIVMIYADDLGWSDVGFNGRKEWQTPNLDKLAAEGMRFTRWYSGAVVCAPSRGVLMTGKYTIHNGVVGNSDPLPPGEVTVAEALKERGYSTALFGKWHLGNRKGQQPLDQGFDEFFGFLSAKHAWQKFPKELVDGREMKPVEGYADTLFADRGVDYIKRHPKDKPFFLYMAFTAPHSLVEAPAEEVEKHKGKFKEANPENPLNAVYAAEITQLDEEVGRLMAALREAGQDENTLVVFSSDHGATFEVLQQGTAYYHDSNRPFRGHKRTLWEGGVRVPGVVRWPGRVPAGRVCEEPVHMMDLFPTFLAAAGGGPPDGAWKVDGVDLLDLWRGKVPGLQSRTLFWEWQQEGTTQAAAMRGNLKLVATGGNKPELFDVVHDPAERMTRQAMDPDVYDRLTKELDAWLASDVRPTKSKASTRATAGAPAGAAE